MYFHLNYYRVQNPQHILGVKITGKTTLLTIHDETIISVMGNSSSKLHVNCMYKCYSINSFGIINDCKFDISGSLVIMVKLTNE